MASRKRDASNGELYGETRLEQLLSGSTPATIDQLCTKFGRHRE